eukprot:283341_1
MCASFINQQPFACNTRETRGSALPFLYFVVFITISAMFFIKLFVGVVYSSFHRAKTEQDGSAFLTPDQSRWLQTQRRILSQRSGTCYKRPEMFVDKYSFYRTMVYDFITHKKFQLGVSVLVCLNIASLAISHYQQSQGIVDFLFASNIVFSALFMIEAGLKIFSLGSRQYFKNRWNRLEFCLVIISIIDISIDSAYRGSLNPSNMVNIMQITRVLRICRLVMFLKSLNLLFANLWDAIPSLSNIVILLLLLLFIFAVLGMDLFGKVSLSAAGLEALDEHTNFSRFPKSAQTMFRIFTGDAWVGIMHDLANCTAAECNNRQPYMAIVFFPISYILMNFFFMNLFVSVILENFYDVDYGGDGVNISQSDVDDFKRVWAKFDSNGSQFLPVHKLPRVLCATRAPIGVYGREHLVRSVISSLDCPVTRASTVEFRAVLLALINRLVGHDMPFGDLNATKLLRPISKICVRRRSTDSTSTIDEEKITNSMFSGKYYTVVEAIAAMQIQDVWRKYCGLASLEKTSVLDHETNAGYRRTVLLNLRYSLGPVVTDEVVVQTHESDWRDRVQRDDTTESI